ncbi:amidase [Pseudonocardia spinosispora]|uniref:amidase n=1 Tax=Pseudonocardia spinosispora TaxID=103441 RepID=UPI000402596E|nr:amidase [Pseudonocardia spinosispora]
MTKRVHAFRDDALGEHDAVELAGLVRDGAVSAEELAEASAARARDVSLLDAITCTSARPRISRDTTGALYGVPTFVKDNTDLHGLPTNHGSEAFTARTATKDGAYATQYLSTGMTVMGKSRLPEFGFNATTEFMTGPPTRNPWDTDYSVGASSGGSAALVAAGVVPLAHANDGGGSIRIPAACAGLVGLKPTRHRHIDGEQARHLPINMISEGVVTRTVRDTAAFLAAIEDHWRNPALPPIGQVYGPAQRRLRIGLVLDSVSGTLDEETRAAVEHTARLLEKAGHHVEPVALPVTEQFAADFLQYWALLAELAADTGKLSFDRSFTADRLDGLTLGLRRHHRRNLRRTPGALRRLRRVPVAYARLFARHELVLTPVLAHTTPLIGHLSPTVEFADLVDRLTGYVAYTPLNNIAGTPAISLPLGTTAGGLPIGVQLSAAHGDERTLLETAYALEAEHPFARINADGWTVSPRRPAGAPR